MRLDGPKNSQTLHTPSLSRPAGAVPGTPRKVKIRKAFQTPQLRPDNLVYMTTPKKSGKESLC